MYKTRQHVAGEPSLRGKKTSTTPPVDRHRVSRWDKRTHESIQGLGTVVVDHKNRLLDNSDTTSLLVFDSANTEVALLQIVVFAWGPYCGS
mgnify:CR=1 FL=1